MVQRGAFQQNVERLEKDIHLSFNSYTAARATHIQTFANSLNWAVRRDRDVWFDHLQVLPGSIFRNKHERFGIEFENNAPVLPQSIEQHFPTWTSCAPKISSAVFCSTIFESISISTASRNSSGLNPMKLLEAFGEWCYSRTHRDSSLTYARTDPRSLPENFLAELAGLDWSVHPVAATVRARNFTASTKICSA